MSNHEKIISVDIAIIGGGIAGLWALNRLRSLGYQTILLESTALGNGQTIKSQGIIHGGIKYALTGLLTGSANAVETMPARWKNCLSGSGEIDLRNVKILAYDQLLWSTGGLGSEIASFFASKALNSRVQKLSRDHYPSVLQNRAFKGQVYRLEEVVLDTPSLVKELATPHSDYLFKVDPDQGCKFIFQGNETKPQNICYLEIKSGPTTAIVQAKRYLLTAGEGNELLATGLTNPPAMQRRPLQMVYVKLDANYPFFAHCIDGGINPRITITSHQTQDGKTVWYLGGQIAEEGINRTQAEQILAAQKELKSLFSWLDLTQAQWGSFFINRAEPLQPGGKRPETDFVQAIENAIVAWPTKLALSPLLTDNIINLLKEQNIEPSAQNNEIKNLNTLALEKPKVALPPWENF